MNWNRVKIVFGTMVGFVAGMLMTGIHNSFAQPEAIAPDLNHKIFTVFIDEIQRNMVFGEMFAGSFKRTLTMSDGSQRTVELTPMVHNGTQVVEIKDGSFHSYTALNGRTTNGSLLIQVQDYAEWRRQLREQGWRLP